MSMGHRGTVEPWRRTIAFERIAPIPLTDVSAELQLTDSPSWGYQLRRGLVSLAPEDFAVLRSVAGLAYDTN